MTASGKAAASSTARPRPRWIAATTRGAVALARTYALRRGAGRAAGCEHSAGIQRGGEDVELGRGGCVAGVDLVEVAFARIARRPSRSPIAAAARTQRRGRSAATVVEHRVGVERRGG